jgi:hypothetical protein
MDGATIIEVTNAIMNTLQVVALSYITTVVSRRS